MNTLYFKVLLIKVGVFVFIRALGIYLLMTLPTLVFPPMYIMSAGYALSFGWIAAPLFIAIFYLLQKLHLGMQTKHIALYAAVVVAVGIAFQMMEETGARERIWQSCMLLLFPFAAVISGWISLKMSKHTISRLFAHNGFSNCISAVTTSLTPENIY